MSKETDTEYLIWSNEHRAWWRPNSNGYTIYTSSAGRYGRDEAIKICRHARDGWEEGVPPPEMPIRLVDVVECKLTHPPAYDQPGDRP